MLEDISRKFIVQYFEVFNEDGSVKLCGRENCKKLIALADQLDDSESHGNIENGNMNIESIKSVHERVIRGDFVI
jgi:hypothetical protein